MTDNDFLARFLADGRWHSRDQIMAASQLVRGCGLTVHSRAADLRKRGHTVEVELRRNDRGRTVSFYRLGDVLEEAADSVEAVRDGSRSTAASSSTPPNPTQTDLPALLESVDSPDDPAHGDEGVLELFTCTVDESAGLRGAYYEPDAA